MFATTFVVNAQTEPDNAYVSDANPYEAMIDPNSLPLEFQFVKLDPSSMVFLPTPDDVVAQTQAVRTRKVSKTVVFEDGVISMTAHIAPGLVERENIPLSFCLDIDEQHCEMLQVWNSKEQNFADTLTITKVYTDVETSVYLELLIPEILVPLLRSELSEGPKTYTIRASVANSDNVSSLGVELAQVTLVDISGERNTRAREGSKLGLSDLPNIFPDLSPIQTDFPKEFANKNFGVKFDVGGKASIYLSTDEVENKSAIGLKLEANAEFDATVFKKKQEDVVKFEAWANVESGDSKPYVDLSLSVLKKNIYSKAWEYEKPRGFAPITKKRDDPLKGLTTVDDIQKLKQDLEKVQQDLEKGMTISAPLSSLLSQQQVGPLSVTSTFVIIIPIEVGGKIHGTLDLKGEIGLKVKAGLSTDSDDFGLSVYGKDIGPKVALTGEAWAAISVVVAKAGVKGKLTLVTNTLGLGAELDVKKLVKDEDFLTVELTDFLEGPKGDIAVFLSYPTLKWDGWFPSTEEKEGKKTLVAWEPFIKEFTLISYGNGKSTNADEFEKNIENSSGDDDSN